jgi:beta-glucanase (GH16 family)
MSKIIDWSGYGWLTQERWGQIHPDKPWNWYDETCVKTVNNELHLDIQYHPKEFDINGSLVTSLFGTGLITCETDFSFGTFEIEAKLPQGSGLWPAFWLYPRNAWPPEIDIFEAYSKNSNYRNKLLKAI